MSERLDKDNPSTKQKKDTGNTKKYGVIREESDEDVGDFKHKEG